MRSLRSLAALLVVACGACAVINGIEGDSERDAGTKPKPNPNPSQWKWHGPVQLDQGLPAESDAPRLALGPDFTAWVVWQDYESSSATQVLWATNRPPGGAWATPQALPPVSGFVDSEYPEIAIRSSGEPVVAFEASTTSGSTTTYSLWTAALPSGLTVSSSDLARVDDSQPNNDPEIGLGNSLAVDSAGKAVMLWGQYNGIYASASSGGTTWSAPTPLDSTSNLGASVNVAANQSGALAGWATNIGLYVEAFGVSGGAVSPGAEALLTSGSGLYCPAVACGSSQCMVSWQSTSGLSSRSYGNGAWGSIQALSDTIAYFPGQALAMNSTGQAVTVWRHGNSGDTCGEYSGTLYGSFYDGSGWSTPQLISDASAGCAWSASVDINDMGQAVAAWADFDSTGTYERIWAAELHFDGGTPRWDAPAPIDNASPNAGMANDPENVRYPGVRLAPDGTNAYVVWAQHETPDTDGGVGTPRTWANWME